METRELLRLHNTGHQDIIDLGTEMMFDSLLLSVCNLIGS